MSEGEIHIRDVAHLREALSLLGSLTDSTHDEVEIAVIGGSALLLGGSLSRVTRHVDATVAWVKRETSE